MIEKVKKNIKYLNYLFIVFFTLILLLRPYQFVIFDSEPDYLANAIHTLQWNIPWGGHHPGTIFQYFFAGVLKFSFFYKFNLETTIFLLRIICLILSILILFLSSKFYLKENISFFKFTLASVIIMPIIYWHISHFGVELILFSISFLVWSHFIKILNEPILKKDILIVPILIGISLSIKFSAIILLFIYLFLIFFNLNFSFIKKIIISIITSIISFFTFFLITLPSVRYYPKLFNKINREINIENLLSNNKFLVLFFIFIILFFVTFTIKNNTITKFSNKFKSEIYYILFPIIFFIIIFLNVIQNFNIDTYQKTGSFYYSMGLFRNFMPLIPLFIIVAYKFHFRINSFIIIIFTCINIFFFYNFFYTEAKIDNIVEKETDKEIITFTTSKFNSKFIFLDYTKRRYGNGGITFPKNWPHTQKFRTIEHSMFFNWIDKKQNIYEEKKEKLKINEKKTYLGKKKLAIRKLFKDKDYSDEKFDIFSLERPFYKQRIIQQDYCEKITNKVIIFDKKNNFNLVQLNKFKKNINYLKKECKFKNIKKNIFNEVYIKYFLKK